MALVARLPLVVLGAFVVLMVWQMVHHESAISAQLANGPPGLTRQTFGVGRVLPLEHSILAFLRGVEARTQGARFGSGGEERKALDLLAREAVELSRRAALRGWDGGEGEEVGGGLGAPRLEAWEKGVYTSAPPAVALPPIVEAFRRGQVDWHDLIPSHASLWERYGESNDGNFKFMTLVMKEEKVTDYLTRWEESGLSAVYGVDHGPLSNYTSCNTFDDARRRRPGPGGLFFDRPPRASSSPSAFGLCAPPSPAGLRRPLLRDLRARLVLRVARRPLPPTLERRPRGGRRDGRGGQGAGRAPPRRIEAAGPRALRRRAGGDAVRRPAAPARRQGRRRRREVAKEGQRVRVRLLRPRGGLASGQHEGDATFVGLCAAPSGAHGPLRDLPERRKTIARTSVGRIERTRTGRGALRSWPTSHTQIPAAQTYVRAVEDDPSAMFYHWWRYFKGLHQTATRDGGLDQGGTRVRPWPTAPISVVSHSFRLIFRRAIVSRSGLEARMFLFLFLEHARAEPAR